MHLTFEKLTELTKHLAGAIYRDAIPLTAWQIVDDLGYGVPLPPDDDPAWQPLPDGAAWGSRLRWAWLKTAATIPATFAGKTAALRVQFEPLRGTPETEIFSPPEALVAVSGIETPPQTLDMIHHEVVLAESAPGDTPLEIVLDMFAGSSQVTGHRVRFRRAELVWIDREVEALYWDARVLLETIAALPENAPERGALLRTLNEAFAALDWRNPPDAAFSGGVRAAREHLQSAVFAAHSEGDPRVPRPRIHALGHAHIDVEWLWPLDVTRGKAQRTFATALLLMERFPAYTFTQSQPQLYQLLAETRPDIYEHVKARVAEGRLNPTGATWVEPDTNLPGGEALVRQFLFGMRYFERELGVRPEVLWLPDVFGYSAALPQIMRLAGVRYFYTSKLSWNQYTDYPYDTFWWEGLDGSRVLTQLATTPEVLNPAPGQNTRMSTYNARMQPLEIVRTWERYKQKAYNHHLPIAYGLGDGGGGPSPEMVERAARMADVPGLPQVQFSTAEDFFHALENTVPDDLPRWVGELYFQLHRGTFTSQARTKRYNRKTEALLHSAEAVSALAHLLGAGYPQDALNAAWEIVLLHQFHDILPGSSIREVYEEVEARYEHAQDLADGALDDALAFVAAQIASETPGFAVFNTLGTALGGPVELELPGEGAVDVVAPDGSRLPVQWVEEDARHALILPEDVPAYGYRTYTVAPSKNTAPLPHAVQAAPDALDNGLIRAEFDAQGRLVRVYDREHDRDALAEGQIGNQLWAYVDRPHHWDAWDIEAYVQDQGWPVEPSAARLVEAGPLRATLEVEYAFNQSHITQRISLLAGQRALTFETDVDWHERHILLRVHFPLAIRATDATYEIQFGTVQRPTHENTPWDQARHEVPAQQWADLSEAGYGVALLNDCKYGYSARDNVLTMSLLRAPMHPDPEADQGAHTFTYALLPHAGDWRNGVIEQARRLNHPLRVRPVGGGGALPAEFALVTCDAPGVQIDTIKRAEDSDALIVRVHEAHGGRTRAALRFASPITHAEEVNLLEEPLGAVEVAGDTLSCALAPYQIRSFHVALGGLTGG